MPTCKKTVASPAIDGGSGTCTYMRSLKESPLSGEVGPLVALGLLRPMIGMGTGIRGARYNKGNIEQPSAGVPPRQLVMESVQEFL